MRTGQIMRATMRYATLWALVVAVLGPTAGRARAGPFDLSPAQSSAPTAPATTPAGQPTTASAAQEFPTWGVTLTPPANWVRGVEPDLTTMAQWVPPDQSRASLTVVVTPTLDRTARAVAEKTAQMVGGALKETTLGIRGAWQVIGGKNGEAAVYTTRDKYLYEIRYQGPQVAGAVPADLEKLRASWQWTPVESPVKHPEVRPDALIISNQMSIVMPNHMRPWAAPPPPPGHLDFGAVDISAQRIKREFDMDLSMPAALQGQPLDQIIKTVDAPIRAKLGLQDETAWRRPDNANDRVISQILVPPAPASDPDQKPRTGSCLGIVALDNDRRVLLSFTVNSDDPDVRFAYFAMAEKILASVQALGVPATAPAAAPAPAPASKP
jgi:hypothetical protein